MAHLSPERLAALASDPDDEPTPDEREHLRGCAVCRHEAAGMDDLVRDARLAGSRVLQPPPPEVWARVQHDLGAGDPSQTRSRDRRPWRRTAVAAAAGLAVGVGGTLAVSAARSPAGDDLVARTTLAPLPGEVGAGSAELVREQDSLQLLVHASLGSSPTGDYHEVWLINSDGRRMVALGVLPASGDGRYWLPAPLAGQLDGYRTVDISVEPDDGVVAHSQHSLVRGRLST